MTNYYQKKLANLIMQDFGVVRKELGELHFGRALGRLWKIHLNTVELVKVMDHE